ncbi:MAG TPA: HAD-IA family hydrolase [Acidimicrobiales bacterium]
MAPARKLPVMEGLRAVAFDFYGTLVVQDEGEAAIDAGILASQGCTVDDSVRMQWIDPVTALDHVPFSTDVATYGALCDQLWRRLLLDAGAAPSGVDGLVRQARARGLARQLVPFGDAVSSLRAVRAGGLQLAICSNWGWELPEVVRSCGLPDVFDVVLSSAEAGYRKPHPRIFELLVERLGLDAGSVLFVGDSVEADVLGAKSAGLRAVELCPSRPTAAGPVSSVSPVSPVPSVSSLAELAALVMGSSEASRREIA